MLINFLTFIYIVIISWSDAEDSQGILSKGSADYKIEYTIVDEDTEMIKEEQLIPFKINDTVNKFKELNKICRREYIKKMRSKSLVRKHYKGLDQSDLELRHQDRRWLKNVKKALQQFPLFEAFAHLQHRRQLDVYDIIDEPEYNYDALADEYIAQEEKEKNSNETYHPVKIDSKGARVSNLLKRMFTLNTRLEEQASRRQSRDVLTYRILKVAQIWMLIYVVVAIPLWCTLGWCCCCLCCKSFKARETIDNARRYMIWNPPGVLRDNSGDILYEPSNKEIETYEQLEHVIKTL